MKEYRKNRNAKRRHAIRLRFAAAALTVSAAFVGVCLLTNVFVSKNTELAMPDGRKTSVSLASKNAVLIDLDSGKILLDKNSDKKIYPASLTKIMTALVTIEHFEDLDYTIEICDGAYAYIYKNDASYAGFCEGERISVRDVLYGILLASGAECCLTCAEEIAGGEQEFIKLMNQKASEIGMKNTRFANCTGLQNSGHYSTVEDIALLLRYALNNEIFKEVFTAHWYISSPTEYHPDGLSIQSTMFSDMQSEHYDGGEILGGKTGYTVQAGRCLASLAIADGREYILVTAGAKEKPEKEHPHIDDAFAVYSALAKG